MLSSLSPFVPVMESTDARRRNHLGFFGWLGLDGTWTRSILVEAVMRAVLVVVPDVVPQQPAQVPFSQHDHVVKHLSATIPYPLFRGSILPGRMVST